MHRCCLYSTVEVILAACSLIAGCGKPIEREYRITDPVDPLPALSEITGMSAMLDGFGVPVPRFEVPRSHWAAVRSAMLPSEVDREPTVWEILGALEIAAKDGSAIEVQLYYVGDVGAFSIGGEYYRGGSSPRLEEAIRLAHRATSTSDVPK
jgi:hypothetical protein